MSDFRRNDKNSMHSVNFSNRDDRRAVMWMMIAVVIGILWLLAAE
jgi:hypothetical protein